MDWQAVGTIVALLGVIASLAVTIRGQQQERKLAENSAARSEAASGLTEGYTARVVDALEAIAASGSLGGTPATVAARVKWSMRHHGGDTYIVENVGDVVAHGVELSSDPTLGMVGVTGGPDVAPGEAMTFLAALTFDTRDSTITVAWDNPDGTSGEWRYPLPSRPPR